MRLAGFSKGSERPVIGIYLWPFLHKSPKEQRAVTLRRAWVRFPPLPHNRSARPRIAVRDERTRVATVQHTTDQSSFFDFMYNIRCHNMEVRYVRLSRSFHTQVFRPRHKSQVTLAASASNAAIARFPSRDAKCRGEATITFLL